MSDIFDRVAQLFDFFWKIVSYSYGEELTDKVRKDFDESMREVNERLDEEQGLTRVNKLIYTELGKIDRLKGKECYEVIPSRNLGRGFYDSTKEDEIEGNYKPYFGNWLNDSFRN